MKPYQYFLMLLFLCSSARAQTFMRHKAKPHELPPSAILVQLNTGNNQIKYFRKFNKEEDLKKATAAINTANLKMIEDFSDNFTYCPVYYFYDTNRQAIIERKFSDILLDKELKPLGKTVIAAGDTSYFIVRYGITEDAEEMHQKVLVASNASGYQLKYPLPYKAYPKYIHKRVDDYNKYEYTVGKYSVEYHGLAAAYNLTLERFYRTHPRKKRKTSE